MKPVLVAMVVVGCGGAVPAPPLHHAAIHRPHSSYAIDLDQLGDPGIVEKISHRARLVPSEKTPQPSILPVVGETGDRVRVVSTDDDVRVAVWVARATIEPAVVAPIELDGGDSDHGVWLAIGADVHVRGSDDPRDVTLVDRQLDATGLAPAAALGTVWVGGEPVTPPDGEQSIVKGTTIHVAPSDDARVLAVAREGVDIHVVATHGDWADVEIARPAVRVRGFVRAASIRNMRELSIVLTSSHGYGMSDTEWRVVPAGACIYDRPDGEVIGVALATKGHYVMHAPEAPWATVWVGTEYWGTTQAALRVIADDTKTLRVETCTK